jgi:tRNA-2-methylthio-N6-dimethylallyladenosine synthase
MENSSTSRKNLYIRTFGCQMNEYDTLKLEKILENDYQTVPDAKDADLILINTCSVRDKPEQKLYSLLGEIKSFKNDRPGLMIGVGGCVAQQEGENITKRSKNVDFVFGTHNLSLVPSLIQRRLEGFGPQVAVDYRDEWEELPAGFIDKDRVSAFVSISRGCNKNCTYCIVPKTRGVEVSRPVYEIEREVKIAAKRGAKEVVLLGQTVNSYGLDLIPRVKFTELLKRISEIEGIERIRFTSPHPQEVKQDFIELVAGNPKICRHIHMPLQSGSNRILKAMNRNYRREKYLNIIESLKEKAPDMAITTDIIVGFPGETEEDFYETIDIMNKVQFDNSYSFMFSPRPGTKAALLKEELSADEKLERLKLLQARQMEITTARLGEWVGKEVEVLIDGKSAQDETRFQGRTSQNLTFNFTTGNENGALKEGQILNCLVKECSKYTLKGEPLLT